MFKDLMLGGVAYIINREEMQSLVLGEQTEEPYALTAKSIEQSV